jgi:DNA polymerase-3 subunit delta'
MPFLDALSPELQALKPVQVLESSFKEGRLAHAILFHGVRMDVLEEIALAFAKSLLGSEADAHPDLFSLRPANKMRQISADAIRGLVKDLHHTPHQAERKIAIVYDADRLNIAAANAFLKTLEEPPGDTIIFLLTTRPYDLLDTIRSRCFHFKIPADLKPLEDENWQAWVDDYKSWILQGWNYTPSKKKSAELILKAYGLVSRFEALIEDLSKEYWKQEQEKFDKDRMEDEAWQALEVGATKGLRDLLFSEITQATRDIVVGNLEDKENIPLRMVQWSRVVAQLDTCRELMDVNYKESATMEAFLLRSLRIWTQK